MRHLSLGIKNLNLKITNTNSWMNSNLIIHCICRTNKPIFFPKSKISHACTSNQVLIWFDWILNRFEQFKGLFPKYIYRVTNKTKDCQIYVLYSHWKKGGYINAGLPKKRHRNLFFNRHPWHDKLNTKYWSLLIDRSIALLNTFFFHEHWVKNQH